MKTTLKLAAMAAIAGPLMLQAQNASSYVNNAPINGTDCSAFGYNALILNSTSGTENAAIGKEALRNNFGGSNNTAAGNEALYSNTASNNTGVGHRTLKNCMGGSENTGFGEESFGVLSGGMLNSGMGSYTGFNTTGGSMNTAFSTASNFTNPGDNMQTAIGRGAVCYQNNMIELGDANVIKYQAQPTGYTNLSDGRYKFNVSDKDVKGLAFVTQLRPVVYNLDTRKKTEFMIRNFPKDKQAIYLNTDFSIATAIRRSGFIAQEVEQAAIKSGYDFDGIHKPKNESGNYGLGYDQFVVPLVKAVQEQQEQLRAAKNTIADQGRILSQLLSGGSEAGQADFYEQGVMLEASRTAEGNIAVSYALPASVANASIGIYDLAGRQVDLMPVSAAASSAKLAKKQARGIYICSVIADGQLVASKRIIVE